MDLRSSLALIVTGTFLNIVSQMLVSTKNFADSSTQILPWIKYMATLLPAALSRAGQRNSPPLITPQQRTWLNMISVLDVLAYTLFSLAYFSCGAALSNLLLSACAQVFTALSTRFLLNKRLNFGQWSGFACILGGLTLRGLPAGKGSTAAVALTPEQWKGVAMIVAAAAMYTGIGVLYEQLIKTATTKIPHADIMFHTSKLGFILSSVYQLLYTLPRFDSLVTQRMAQNQVTLWEVLPLLLAFGLLFNLHMLAQALNFRSSGAIGVGVVNSVRGAVLTVVTSLLFCNPKEPWLCMTSQSGISAAVTTLGGVVWVLSDPKARAPAPPAEKAKAA